MRGFIRIGRILGIPIGINPSWFLLLIFVVFTLATQVFPDVFGEVQESKRGIYNFFFLHTPG